MTTIFSNGFENGDFSAWTGTNHCGTGVNLSVQSTVVNEGTYGMQTAVAVGQSENGYCIYKDLGTNYSTIYARAYIRLSAMPAAGTQLSVFGYASDGWLPNAQGTRIDIYNNNGTLQWLLCYYNNGWNADITGNISLNTWYCVELKLVMANGSGETHLYVDGTDIIPKTGLNNAGSVRCLCLGVDNVGNSSSTYNLYADSVVVADSYIGPINQSQTYHLEFIQGANQTKNTGEVSNEIIVQVQDSNNNPVTTGATVYLDSTSSGGHFYSDQEGTNQITYKIIPQGQSSCSFYYKDTTAGNPTLTTSATGLTSATTVFTISQGGSGDQTVTGNLSVQGNASIGGVASVNGYVTTSGYVTASGGTSNGPGYRFSTYGPSGYFGGQTGVGLNNSGQIVLNAGSGGVVTASAGDLRNTLDDGSGNMTLNVRGSRINLTNQYGQLVSIYADNSSATYQYPYLHVQYGILADDITAHGFIGTSSDTLEGGWGGGAIMMGHGLEWPTDPPRITLTDYSTERGGFRELALTAGSSANYDQYGNPISYNGVNGILADLRLNKLTLNAISSVSTDRSVTWNNNATNDWTTIGGFLFRNSYNNLGMEFKCTTHNFNLNGNTTLYPVIQLLYWESETSFITVHQFNMNGDFHLLGDLHYGGTLIHSFDSIDDFATLKSLKTVADEKGTEVYDKESLAFLKDNKGLLSLSSCLGWELSVQRKFLAKHEEHEANIAKLLKRIEDLEIQLEHKKSA